MKSQNKIEVRGIPYEGRENFLRGTFLGPAKIRWAFESIEWFSIYQKKEIPDFYDHGDLYLYLLDEPEKFIEGCVERLNQIHLSHPFVALGGDHLITYPLIKYLKEKNYTFKVIHLDAHLDRRDSFHGSRFSHATVIRRIEELLGPENVISFGFRSYYPEEHEAKRGEAFKVFEPLRMLVQEENGPFYLTIDLDILDPSIMSAVSNPEPGGINFDELLNSILLLKDKLLGVDMVELNPLLEKDHASSTLAAVIFREILITLGGR